MSKIKFKLGKIPFFNKITEKLIDMKNKQFYKIMWLLKCYYFMIMIMTNL